MARRRKRMASVLLGLVGLATACGSEPESAPVGSLGVDCGTPEQCDHPLNKIVFPRFKQLGVPVRQASSAELCRRMAVDFIGHIPMIEQLDACEGKTPAQIVDMVQADPNYTRTQARLWAELTELSSRNWFPLVVDLDRLVRRLYEGEIEYSRFAGELFMHPGFYAQRDRVFRPFFGRPARPDEARKLTSLGFMWNGRLACNGTKWFNAYQVSIARGTAEAASVAFANKNCSELEPYVDFCGCDFAGSCENDVFGQNVSLGSEGCVSFGVGFRVLGHLDMAAETDLCPDGSRRPECRTRELTGSFENPTILGPAEPLAVLSDALREKLYSVGAAMATRTDFWEAAADRELERLLGWWRSGFKTPDQDLPEVRAWLAEALKNGLSIREAQKLIATSVLYASPADRAPNLAEDAPDWAAGPTKLLAAESWLDSLAVATGETLGVCDYRTLNTFDFPNYSVYPSLVERKDPTLAADVWPAQQYIRSSRQLGGCDARKPRATASTVAMVSEQSTTSTTLCGRGRGVLPPGFDPSGANEALAGAARYVARRLLSQTPSDEDVKVLVEEMQGCLAAKEEGCADPEQAVRWVCQHLVDSAAFALY